MNGARADWLVVRQDKLAFAGRVPAAYLDSLVFDPRLRMPGVRCPRCAWMAPSGERCPVDGGPVETVENILEPAAEAALLQSAQTLRIADRPELAGLGGIAAMLRF